MKRKSFLQNLKSLWSNQKPKQEKKLFMWRKGTKQLLWNISLLSQALGSLSNNGNGAYKKRHLESEFPLPPANFIVLVPSRSIRQMLVNFSGVQFLRTVSKFRKRKRKSLSCVHFTIKSEIRQFHVVVVQQRQRNVQKRVMRVQSCCFANLSLLFFCPLLLPLSLSLLKLPIFSKIAL